MTDDARAARDAVDRLAGALADDLAAWSGIPSGSTDAPGLHVMLDRLRERAARLPATVEEVGVPPAPAPALSLRCRPEAAVQALLVGHYDTVFGRDDPFTTVTRVDADTLRGPGACDMKGGILVMLTALGAVESLPGAAGLGWRVLLTPDEEVGSPGSAPLLGRAAGEAHVGLVFEPAADGNLVRARRGRDVIDLEAIGRAAHAGRDPWTGRSAVLALAEVALAAEGVPERIPGLTLNVGTIGGGTAANVVPARAWAEAEARADRAEDLAAAREHLCAAAREVGARREVAVAVRRRLGIPPLPVTPAREALFAAHRVACADLGLAVGWRDMGGVSDGNLLGAAGLPVLDGLGVVGGGLHGPEEWVHLPSLRERAAAACLFLHRLATGRVPL